MLVAIFAKDIKQAETLHDVMNQLNKNMRLQYSSEFFGDIEPEEAYMNGAVGIRFEMPLQSDKGK